MSKTVNTNVKGEEGFTLIEVLVTFLIVTAGLLGLAALQAKTLNEQMEAYQRLQASVLVSDMVGRIRLNPAAAAAGEYPAGTAYGVGSITCTVSDANSRAANDLCEWQRLIAGVSVTSASANVGSPIAARGCISTAVVGDGVSITISVAWQGLSSIGAPDYTCGTGLYGDDDGFRRVLSRKVVVRG